MKQEERRARTIGLLIQEASRAFAEHGYDRTTLDAIAAAAGVSKGAVYAHFTSKLELFNLVVDRAITEAETRLADVVAAVARGEDPMAAAWWYVASMPDDGHAGLMAEVWRVALVEDSVREKVDSHRDWRLGQLGTAAVDAGYQAKAALDRGAMVARLIDAAIVEERFEEAARRRSKASARAS